jgi:hypothetical protein
MAPYGERFECIRLEVDGMGVQLDLHRQLAVGAGLIWGEQGDLQRDRALRILLRQVTGRACHRHGALRLSLHAASHHPAAHGEHPAEDQQQAEGQCYAVRRSFHGCLLPSIFFAVVV